jgi:hypothetical protein
MTWAIGLLMLLHCFLHFFFELLQLDIRLLLIVFLGFGSLYLHKVVLISVNLGDHRVQISMFLFLLLPGVFIVYQHAKIDRAGTFGDNERGYFIGNYFQLRDYYNRDFGGTILQGCLLLGAWKINLILEMRSTYTWIVSKGDQISLPWGQ